MQQTQTDIQVLRRDTLREGGFAGLREHRLVMDQRVFGFHKEPSTWNGLGNFVYLADARFFPKGETHMHGHREIDVISVMIEGRITHEGSLEHGQEIGTHQVQVQRAGGEGFQHNEINPDDTQNRMIQIWVLPETPGQPAGYKVYTPEPGKPMRIYGGEAHQDHTFPAQTSLEVARLNRGDILDRAGNFMIYLTQGEAIVNGTRVQDGDLVRGEDLLLVANQECQCILIRNT